MLGIVALVVAGGITGAVLLTGGGDDSGSRPFTYDNTGEVANEGPFVPPAEETAPPAATDPDPAASGDGDGETAEEPDANSPSGVVRAHWTAIRDRDYAAAYSLFASSYGTPESKWINDEANVYSPRVRIKTIRFLEILPGARATVFVDVYTRDMAKGRDHSLCHRFAGKVVVVKESGSWRYTGRGPTWGPKGDYTRRHANCRQLFA